MDHTGLFGEGPQTDAACGHICGIAPLRATPVSMNAVPDIRFRLLVVLAGSFFRILRILTIVAPSDAASPAPQSQGVRAALAA